MSQFDNQSSVNMPVTEYDKAMFKKLNIKLITAQLIVDLEKDFNNRSLGPEMSPIFITTIASVLKLNKACRPKNPPANIVLAPGIFLP